MLPCYIYINPLSINPNTTQVFLGYRVTAFFFQTQRLIAVQHKKKEVICRTFFLTRMLVGLDTSASL